MRTFTITLAQNTGLSTPGAELDITQSITQIGPWIREAEKELTKLSPSQQTFTLMDLDGSIWSWIYSQLPSSGGNAFYPPWITVDIDGDRAFTGLVYPKDKDHDEKTGKITLNARDWSTALTSKYLGADSPDDDLNPARNPWLRAYPKAVGDRPALSQTCWLLSLGRSPEDYDMLDWQGPQQWVEVGDFITADDLPTLYPGFPAGKQYKCRSVGNVQGAGGPDPNWWWGTFEGLGQDLWDHKVHTLNTTSTFTRVAQASDLRSFYVVTKTVAADAKDVHVIDLDNVDGIVPGDSLTTIGTASSQTWTVLQVDAEAMQVVTQEEVTSLQANVSHLFFTSDSLQDLVLDDARAALKRAALPYSVNLSRYQPPTVTTPVLVWLPLRPLDSQDLTSIRDLDAGLADVRVYGSGSASWNGTPDAGWFSTTDSNPRAAWTDQTTAQPASLMPWESSTLLPTTPARNKVVAWWLRNLTSVAQAGVPDGVLVYDYLLMRRVLVKKDLSYTLTPWAGNGWGTVQAGTWQWSGPLLDLAIMPGAPGSLIALSSAGLQLVTLPSGSSSPVLALPEDAIGGVLRTTPWGCYLVGEQGYGRINYASGNLSLSWVSLTANVTSFYPQTFQGLDAGKVIILARFDGRANPTDTTITTETHLLRLSASPVGDASAAVLATEKVLDGAPKTLGAVRDPSKEGRIIGHCGGRLFVYGTSIPAAYAIERYTPSGMKAMELIEHICQVLNAMAIPDPLGTLHIISRGLAEAPIDLTVDRIESTETRAWEHFYTIVRVSSAKDETVLADARGQDGGDVLEYSQHPLLWMQSGCDAVAQALSAWFGKYRRARSDKWFWTDPDSAAPWESLPPLPTIRINGNATKWLLLGLEDDKPRGYANVKLVEVF